MSKTSKKTGQKYSRFFSLTTYATESVKATAFTTPNKPQKSPTSNARKDFLFYLSKDAPEERYIYYGTEQSMKSRVD